MGRQMRLHPMRKLAGAVLRPISPVAFRLAPGSKWLLYPPDCQLAGKRRMP
jgi:hypothetical protein